MATKISASELARNLSDILNRVKYQGERFQVERNGELIAEIGPPLEPTKTFTVEDFRRRFGHLKVPEGLGASIEEGRKALRLEPESPWPSL